MTESTGTQPNTGTTDQGQMQAAPIDINLEDTLEAGHQQQMETVTPTRAS